MNNRRHYAAGRFAHVDENIVKSTSRLRAVITALMAVAAASSFVVLGSVSSAAAAPGRAAVHPQSVPGCDTWDGGDGPWTDASNWSTGNVPTSGVNACISASGSYTVTLEGDLSVNSLTVGGGASGVQTLAIDSNNGVESLLTFETNSEIQANGAIDVNSGSTSSTFDSSLDAGADTGATMVNDGTLDDSGFADQFGCEITNDADGTVTLAAASTVEGSYAFANSGNFTVSGGAELQGSGLAFTQSGGTFDDAGTAQFNGAPFTQSGGAETGNPILLGGGETFNDSAGHGSFQLEGLNDIDGTIPAGQTVTLVSSPSVGTEAEVSPALVNDGTLVMTSTGASSDNSISDGVLTNNSTIDVSGTNSVDTFSGVVVDNEPGGVLDVTNPGSEFNNGILNNEGTLEVGTGGGISLSGEKYGVTVQTGKTAEITGAGSMTLGGSTLQVTTVGKLPKAKTIFTLIDTSGGVSGTFGTLDFPAAAYNVAYTPTTVTLTAEKPFKARAKAVKSTVGTSATVTVATLTKVPAAGTIGASINWGDGSASSTGTVTTSGTRGTVSGTHTYTSAGSYTVTTTITDSNGTDFTVTGRATVKAPRS